MGQRTFVVMFLALTGFGCSSAATVPTDVQVEDPCGAVETQSATEIVDATEANRQDRSLSWIVQRGEAATPHGSRCAGRSDSAATPQADFKGNVDMKKKASLIIDP